jgi:hypothetical protein
MCVVARIDVYGVNVRKRKRTLKVKWESKDYKVGITGQQDRHE